MTSFAKSILSTGIGALFVSVTSMGFARTAGQIRDTKPTKLTIAAAPVSQPPDYSKEAYVIKKYDCSYSYKSDGTWDATTTVVVRVQSQAGIQAFGNVSIPYEAANQQAEIAYVRVRKPDGTVVATSAANIQDVPAGVTLQAPMYSDLHIKQLPVTNLNPGDTLEYQLSLKQIHPEVPNQFWLMANFIEQGIVLEEHVEIRVPAKKYVKVVSADLQPTVHQDGDEKVYEWQTSHLKDTSEADSTKAVEPSKPSIQLTTFESWQQLGEWYRTLQADRVVVTPAIQKQEQEITQGLTTDDAKQRAIYSYVSTQFRYIGLSFGIGRLQPHTADMVLENKFGDCKDKHTLFAALMKAAGYPVWPALIGSAIKLDPDVPSPAQFDHLISVLPRGKSLVWLDTTEEVAPFGMLMSLLRDKQALVMPTTGTPELKRTPVDPPFPEADVFSMKAALDKNAVLTGHADLTTRGDIELLLRAAFHATPQENWTKLGQNVSYMFGFGGEVSNFQADNPDDTSKPFHLQYDYKRKDYGGGDNKQITPPLPPVSFLVAENAKQPDDTIPLGAPGERDYRATVELPKGDVATLVADKDLVTDFAEYRETSSVKDGTLIAERFYNVKISKLPTARWDDYLKFVKAVDARENLMISIATGDTNLPATGSSYVQAARDLVDQAYAAMLANQFKKTEDLLKRAQAVNPTQWGLEATYGDLYFRQNKKDQAIEAYRREMANHPDNLRAGQALAGTLIVNGRIEEASQVLEKLLSQAPDDVQTIRALTFVRIRQKRYDDAVTLLKKVADTPNGTPEMQVALGQLEFKAGHKDDAIDKLEKVMRTAQKPLTINNAAYELADHDVDLAEAQQYAQKALTQMETATGKTTFATLTNDDLAAVTQLSATWDTVGWIDFKLGRYAEAEPYLRASWMLDQHGAGADHLGQTYEKEGKDAPALHMYRLALTAGGLENAAATQQRLDALSRMSQGNVTRKSKKIYVIGNALDREALSKLRTFSIPGAPKKFASAEYFMLLGPHGVEDVQFIKGNDSLRGSIALLKKTNYGEVFPDSGPEKIVRRGVLSCSADTVECDFVLLLPQTARVN